MWIHQIMYQFDQVKVLLQVNLAESTGFPGERKAAPNNIWRQGLAKVRRLGQAMIVLRHEDPMIAYLHDHQGNSFYAFLKLSCMGTVPGSWFTLEIQQQYNIILCRVIQQLYGGRLLEEFGKIYCGIKLLQYFIELRVGQHAVCNRHQNMRISMIKAELP